MNWIKLEMIKIKPRENSILGFSRHITPNKKMIKLLNVQLTYGIQHRGNIHALIYHVTSRWNSFQENKSYHNIYLYWDIWIPSSFHTKEGKIAKLVHLIVCPTMNNPYSPICHQHMFSCWVKVTFLIQFIKPEYWSISSP